MNRGKTKAEKVILALKDARHKAGLVCIAPEHVRYEST